MLDLNDFSKKQIIVVKLLKGEKISFQNDNLIIKDKSSKTKGQVTCYRIFCVFLIGDSSITTGLIKRANKFGFSIILASNTFRIYHIIGQSNKGNTKLNRAQYQYNDLNIARWIIKNKIINQKSLLQKIRNRSDEINIDIEKINSYICQIEDCDNLQYLMGYEGQASHLFFKHYFDKIMFKGRKPRIKSDMPNCILDIGYTILFSFTEALLQIYGFDVYCGVLHKEFYMRKSLVCDIVEPFRCIIDAQVKKSINLNQFKIEDFLIDNNRYMLKWEKSQEYSKILLEAILQHKREIFSYVQSYYRAFMKMKSQSNFPVFHI